MLNILLASARQDHFRAFRAELADRYPMAFSECSDGASTLKGVKQKAVDLVIVDEDLGDMTGVALIRQLLGVNALVNTVLVSTESPEDFHEHTEGLGILMPLPATCGKAEADQLAECLERLGMLRK